jgi:hypothetical protein
MRNTIVQCKRRRYHQTGYHRWLRDVRMCQDHCDECTRCEHRNTLLCTCSGTHWICKRDHLYCVLCRAKCGHYWQWRWFRTDHIRARTAWFRASSIIPVPNNRSALNGILLSLANYIMAHCMPVLHGHTGAVHCAAVHGHTYVFVDFSDWLWLHLCRLATGSLDSTVRVWDVRTGECVRVFTEHAAAVNTVAFASVDAFVAPLFSSCTFREDCSGLIRKSAMCVLSNLLRATCACRTYCERRQWPCGACVAQCDWRCTVHVRRVSRAGIRATSGLTHVTTHLASYILVFSQSETKMWVQ